MSQENINIVKEFYKPAIKADLTNARQFLDPNVEWIEPEIPGLPFGGTHRGPDAVFNEVIRPAYERMAGFGLQVDHFFDVGDNVIAIGHCYGRGKTTNKELNARMAHAFTLKDGKIIRFEGFHEPTTWLEAFGTLKEPELALR